MAIYVADPWDALSPGFSGAPPGWGLFGSSTVSASDGAFPGHNFGSGFFGPLSSPIFNDITPSASQVRVQAMFGAKIDPSGNPFIFSIAAKDITGNPLVVFTLQQEIDQSLTMYTGGSTNPLRIASPPAPFPANVAANTGVYQNFFFHSVWYYFTLQVQIQADPLGSGTLQVTATLGLDGNTIISGAVGTGIPLSNFVTSMGAIVSAIDQVTWTGNTGFLTQVQISDWGTPLPDTTPPNDRISQMVIEPGIIDNPNARISQMVNEIGQLQNPRVRISQMVIELATPFMQRGIFPEYIKRRNLFGNN